MINEIRRRLEAGEKVELECTERSLFLNVNDGVVFDENLEILESGLVVDRVSRSTISLLDCPHPIMVDEVQYFRIKEHSPTFDDLVDVVVQAAKDGLLEINMLNSEFITASIPGDHDSTFVTGWRTKPEAFESSINKVESLYTETFTIKREEDISKVRGGAEIVLTNGSRGIAESQHCHLGESFLHIVSGDYSTYLYLFSLKGATVTQKKTNN